MNDQLFKNFISSSRSLEFHFVLDKCLNGLIIDSTGIAKQYQPKSLGLYLNHKLFNGERSFKHVNNHDFFYRVPPNKWKVSTGIVDKFFDSIEHDILKFYYLYHFYGRFTTN